MPDWKQVAIHGYAGAKAKEREAQRAGRTSKFTEIDRRNSSGDHGTTFKYPDGCLTVYRHEGGRVIGWHSDAKGNSLGKFDKSEGSAQEKHPHHPEGQKTAQQKSAQGTDWLGELALAWNRALRMYRR